MSLIGFSDNLLSLFIMFAVVFSVTLPEFGLLLVKLVFVLLLLEFFFHLTIQVGTHVLFLFLSEFFVLFVFLLLTMLLKSHMFLDLFLLHLDHLLLLFDHSIILLINEFESLLLTSKKFVLAGFLLFIKESAIILLSFNIPLFFFLGSLDANLFIDFIFFFEAFEMFDALDFSL